MELVLLDTYDVGGREVRTYEFAGFFFGRIGEGSTFGPFESEAAVVRDADAHLAGVR